MQHCPTKSPREDYMTSMLVVAFQAVFQAHAVLYRYVCKSLKF